MASLLAARRQHLAAAFRLHACAEAVRLGAPAFARLKCALWQNNPPFVKCDWLHAIGNTQSQCSLFHPQRQNSPLASSAADIEFLSVFDPRTQGQETHQAFPRHLPVVLAGSFLWHVDSLTIQNLANLCRESDG
jgi:hypothetical protein